MRRKKQRVLGRLARRGGTLALLHGLAPRAASAQAEDFALNRPNLGAAGDQFVAVGEPNSSQSSRITTLQLTSHYARDLLQSYSELEDEWTTIVREQWLAHLQARLAVPSLPRLAILVDLPIALVNHGDAASEDGQMYRAPRGPGLGDARIGLRIGLSHAHPVNTAAELEWGLPTARQGTYLGSDQGHAALRLHGDWTNERVRLVASVWGRRDFPDEPILGAELGARAGLGFTSLPWSAGVEALGWVSPRSEQSRSSAHVEVWGHASYQLSAWSFRLAAGPGFALGPGTPAVRALGAIGYSWDTTPSATPIVGRTSIRVHASTSPPAAQVAWHHVDPAEALSAARPTARESAPVGVSPNRVSAQSGVHHSALPHGVPSQGEPLQGEPHSGEQPDRAPLASHAACSESDPGCREMGVGELVELPHAVLFGTGRDVLPIDVEKTLGAAAALLNAHPELVRIAVEGHTDDIGTEAANLALSRRRAVAVMRWLVAHGVDERRLQVRAFGPRYPRFDNASEEGRSQNRRVEFTVIERNVRGRDAWHVGAVPEAAAEAKP